MSTRNCERTASMRAMFVDSRLQRSSRGGSGLDVSWFSSFPREESTFCDYRRNESGISSLHGAKTTDRAQLKWLLPPCAVIYGSAVCDMRIKWTLCWQRFRRPHAGVWRLCHSTWRPMNLPRSWPALTEGCLNSSEITRLFAAWLIWGSVLVKSRPYVWTTSIGRTAH